MFWVLVDHLQIDGVGKQYGPVIQVGCKTPRSRCVSCTGDAGVQ